MLAATCGAAATLLVPSLALALPTPDTLLGVANIVPWLAGAAVSITGGGYALLRRKLGRRGDLVGGALLGSFIVVAFTICFGAYQWSSTRTEQEVSDLAMFLRCDFSAHESYYNARKKKAEFETHPWQGFGNFHRLKMSQVAASLEAQPNATLLATYRMEIEYHAGIPMVLAGGELRPFEYSRRLELPARLAGVSTRDLYLIDFSPYNRDPALYPTLTSIFAKFDNVYLVNETTVSQRDRYVFTTDGSLRPADNEEVVDWAVRDARWLLDTKRVSYPGINALLSNDELATHLRDEDVHIVLPYNSFWRSADVYKAEYLQPLLTGIKRSRILPIDLHADDTTRRLDRYAKILDDRRFVVAGLTKYDYIYSGVDVAFGIWERLGQDPQRFRLEGFSARLPEAVAINWVADRNHGVTATLAAPFWGSIERIGEHLDVSMGAAVLVFAIMLRMVLFPVGWLESRSRMLRARVEQLTSGTDRPSWSASAPALLRELGVRTGWELAGALVTLALLLPAYKLLAGPSSLILDESFLWIRRLGEPDLALAVAVTLLVFAKLSISAAAKTRWLPLVASLAFAPVLLAVPGAVLLYAVGVLAATTCQDLIARWSCRRALDRALLHTS